MKASGYLLGGGLAWNPTVWGSGAESVEAIELVTAAGERITASATENPDVFWAARGAGSGFFGIVNPLPPQAARPACRHPRLDGRITTARRRARDRRLARAGGGVHRAERRAEPVPRAGAAGYLRAAAADRDGWLCMVTGTAFEDTAEAARAVLAPLADAPVAPLMSPGRGADRLSRRCSMPPAPLAGGRALSRVEATTSDHGPRDLMRAISCRWCGARPRPRR